MKKVDIERDREAVAQVWQRAISALASCDWDTYSALWAHESYVEALHPSQGSWWTGWSEVGDRYQKIIAKGVAIQCETHRMHIRVAPGGNVAWAAMETTVRSGKSGHRVSGQVVVFEKLEGEWRIVLAMDAPKRGQT